MSTRAGHSTTSSRRRPLHHPLILVRRRSGPHFAEAPLLSPDRSRGYTGCWRTWVYPLLAFVRRVAMVAGSSERAMDTARKIAQEARRTHASGHLSFASEPPAMGNSPVWLAGAGCT